MQPEMSWSDLGRTASEGLKSAFKEHLVASVGLPVLISWFAMCAAGQIEDLKSGLVVTAISVVIGLVFHALVQCLVAPFRFERKRAQDNYRRYMDTESQRSALQVQLDQVAREKEAANSEEARKARRLKAAQDYWYGVGTVLHKMWHEEKRITDVWGHTLKHRFETFAKAYFTEPARLRVMDKVRQYGDASINLGPYKFADALIKTSAELRTALEYEDLAAPEKDYDLNWMRF